MCLKSWTSFFFYDTIMKSLLHSPKLRDESLLSKSSKSCSFCLDCQYLSKLTNLTDDVPRLLATNSLTKPKSGQQMCAEYDGLCGHCMYFNEHFADFRWTVHTDLSIAYSAEYWRSLCKLVRFPCKRLIDPLWELIDGFDTVDWFSILQGIS